MSRPAAAGVRRHHRSGATLAVLGMCTWHDDMSMGRFNAATVAGGPRRRLGRRMRARWATAALGSGAAVRW